MTLGTTPSKSTSLATPMLSTFKPTAGAMAASATTPMPSGLPSQMSITDLMGWLSVQMSKSESVIRGQMGDIQATKAQQEKISQLEELLRAQKTGADGDVAHLPAEFANGTFKNEDWYKNMSAEGKATIQALVDKTSQDRYYYEPGVYTPAGGASIPAGFDGTGKIPPGAEAVPGQPGLYWTQGDGSVKTSAIDDTLKGLDNEMSATGSSSEMQMIQLQSAVSARGQALQLISNMISSFNDTSKAIIGNTRGG